MCIPKITDTGLHLLEFSKMLTGVQLYLNKGEYDNTSDSEIDTLAVLLPMLIYLINQSSHFKSLFEKCKVAIR